MSVSYVIGNIDTSEELQTCSTITEAKEYAAKELEGSYDVQMKFVQFKNELEDNGYYLVVNQ